MTETTLVPVRDLTATIEEILANAGLGRPHAAAVARIIAAGERDGSKSHGIHRIDMCLSAIKAGTVELTAEPKLNDDGGTIVRIDAAGGFSSLASEMGAPVLAERAREHGLAAMVINDCVHFSALWPEIEMLTERGIAALSMCPSYAAVAPHGGSEPLLGTNPIAFGWPRRNKPPFVFDFATSMVARGEIELYRRAGDPLPDGWAIDAEGTPTNRPEDALAGALLPFGVHKGSAISIMVELLAGVMIGDLTSKGVIEELGSMALAPRHGELVIAMDPARFAAGRDRDPFERAEALFEAITEQGARLPAQRRFAARARAELEGIPLTDEELARLERYRTLGVRALD